MVEATPDNPQPMDWYLSGYLAGKESGRADLDAEIAALHALAYRAVQGNGKFDAHDEHAAKVRARRVESCEAQKFAAVPWPDEATL
jgi:hypothetical protein